MVDKFVTFVRSIVGQREISFSVTYLDEADPNVSPGATVRVFQNGKIKETIYTDKSFTDLEDRQKAYDQFFSYLLIALCYLFEGEQFVEIIHIFSGNAIDEGNKSVHEQMCDILMAVHQFSLKYNTNDEKFNQIVRLLVDNGFDVKAKDDNNWNALHFVCRYYSGDNLIDIVRLLIDNRIEVNAKTKEDGPLFILCAAITDGII